MYIFFSASFFLFSSCSSDEGVKVFNVEPSVTITSHVDGDTVFANEVATFRATVSDNDNTASELSVQWSFGSRVACPYTPPDTDGGSTCEATVENGEETITVEVRDPKSATGTASVTLNVLMSDAPTVQISSPVASVSYYSDQLIPFTAIIDDAEDEPSDLSYQWESSLDGPLSITGEPESSGEIEGFLSLREGQHAISLTVEDTSGKTTTESVVIEVGGENNTPDCEITAPESGAASILGQGILFTGNATDEDINNNQLTIRWESNQDGVFDTTAANTSGELELLYDGLSKGNHVVTLTVMDEAEASCSDTILVNIGTPPSLTVSAPATGEVYSLGEAIAFGATVSDEEDLASELLISWVSDLDGEFSSQAADSNGNISFNSAILSAGLHNISVTATDTDGLTASSAISIRVNHPPPAPTISLSPDPVYSNDQLVVQVTANQDADGDSITHTYEWYQNGAVTANTTSTVAASMLAVGDVWTIRVTPNDGYVDGTYAEASATVMNSVPVLATVTITPNSGVTNDTVLTCNASATDVDETVSPNVEWTIGGTTYAGATIDLSTTSAMPNDSITCTATVIDSNGGTASDSASVVVDNRAPSIVNSALTPTTVYTNSTVTCTANVSDDDGETPVIGYVWKANGATIGTSSSLQLNNTLVKVSDTLTCEVTVSDGYGATDVDVLTNSISNLSPVIGNLELSPSQPYTNDVLVCSAEATDGDDDALNIAFVWTNLSTNATYASTYLSDSRVELDLASANIVAGDVIQCAYTVTDVHGAFDSDAVSVQILSSSPSFTTAASITPSSGVVTNTTLTCSATAEDPDDGPLTPTYTWSINGIAVATGANYTVLASATNVGDTIGCEASVVDSDGEQATSSASVTIENSTPIVDNIAISPVVVYNDTTVQCSATVTDPDESLNLTYEWNLAGTIVGNSDTLDLLITTAMPLESLSCTAVAVDSQGSSDAATISVTVQNRPPTQPVINILPTTPIEAQDDLVCTVVSASTDSDGHPITYTYEWQVDGVMQASYTTDTIPASVTVAGEQWTCTLTPFDGIDNGSSASDSVTIATDTGCLNNLGSMTESLGNNVGIDWVLLPSCTEPLGRYSISRDFYMMTTEVTNAMWDQVMSSSSGSANHPKEIQGYDSGDAGWQLAVEFANEMSTNAGYDLCYDNGAVASQFNGDIAQCNGYRLPTCGEWEYAARSGSSNQFWTGQGATFGGDYSHSQQGDTTTWIMDGVTNPLLSLYANYNTGNTIHVGVLLPNGFGLYDMHGNLWEYVNDWYPCMLSGVDPNGPVNETSNPYGVNGHALKGGNFIYRPEMHTADYVYAAFYGIGPRGFRLVRTAP